ncbi:MAG: CHAT domain-containing protein [Lachnospiraceae bacterium]|nr:CHAT domain-containing protein [Lachnospiraceae bacterium]
MSISSELQLAKTAYETGQLSQAYSRNSSLLASHVMQADFGACTRDRLLEYLDVVTLQQSLLVLFNRPADYLALEPYVTELVSLIFAQDADFYYAIHAFDACEAMTTHAFLTEAYDYKNKAVSLLKKHYGTCPYLSFMEAICNAQIAFYMEDYYTAIDEATTADSLWYVSENEQVSMPHPANAEASFHTIKRLGINNLLLLCNSYGKINNPKSAIGLLTELLAQNVFDYYQKISAEITLAELYVIAGETELARPLYETYKTSNFSNYPGLTAALNSLSYIFETSPDAFTPEVPSVPCCYSRNMFTVSRYNYGLGLVSAGKYQEALTQFQAVGETGYSMQLALLASFDRSSDIENLRTDVNAYFYRQTGQIIRHYEESLAYNHLARLQYHFNLTLGAYCHPKLSSALAYEFLLNTKYIGLETSYLQKKQQPHSLVQAPFVMQHLPEDTLLLEYTHVRTIDTVSYGVFVVSQKEITYIPLGEIGAIDDALQEWLRLLLEMPHATGTKARLLLADYQTVSQRLRRLLYLPLRAHLAAYHTLLIAPAGELVNFPFSQLSLSGDKTLGDTYAIRYLNTGKELLGTAPSSYHFCADTAKALVVGNPSVSCFVNLPFAESEADMVSYFLHTTACKNEHATISYVQNALNESPDIIHIAAHGIYQAPVTKNEAVDWDILYYAMQHSGIVLAEDTLLSSATLATLDLSHTKLAVLSCCHLGQSAYLGTEGAYGLRRALRLAGCHALIISLWQVDDAASYLWMKAFYEAFTLSGTSIEDAFFIAQDTVKSYEQNGCKPYASPYYWAGFILVSPH